MLYDIDVTVINFPTLSHVDEYTILLLQKLDKRHWCDSTLIIAKHQQLDKLERDLFKRFLYILKDFE